MIYTEDQILKAAVAAYECNRAFSVALGDKTVVPWEWADDLTKLAFVQSTQAIADGRLVATSDSKYRLEAMKTVTVSVLSALVEVEETLPGV